MINVEHRQTSRHSKGVLGLPVLAGVSPYFRNPEKMLSNAGRDINLIHNSVTDVTAIVNSLKIQNQPNIGFEVQFKNTSLGIIDSAILDFVSPGTNDLPSIKAGVVSPISAYATMQQLNVTNILWATDDAGNRTQSQVTHSFTTGTGATGFQISSTRDALVNYNTTVVTAATLAAGAVGSVVLEIASTNSATAGDWKEVGRITNGQVFSLAIAIGCTQTFAGQLSGYVPAGYYAKLRTINTTGTPTYTYNSGQEVLL